MKGDARYDSVAAAGGFRVRGGLMTQASVLKVTANGTTTSPVLRGVWIMERILGQPVPPPPPSVPAVDPDTRGATTIREQLAKHRTQATCTACHAKIDPRRLRAGVFDVFGGWRDHYRAIGDGPVHRPNDVAAYDKNTEVQVTLARTDTRSSSIRPGRPVRYPARWPPFRRHP